MITTILHKVLNRHPYFAIEDFLPKAAQASKMLPSLEPSIDFYELSPEHSRRIFPAFHSGFTLKVGASMGAAQYYDTSNPIIVAQQGTIHKGSSEWNRALTKLEALCLKRGLDLAEIVEEISQQPVTICGREKNSVRWRLQNLVTQNENPSIDLITDPGEYLTPVTKKRLGFLPIIIR